MTGIENFQLTAVHPVMSSLGDQMDKGIRPTRLDRRATAQAIQELSVLRPWRAMVDVAVNWVVVAGTVVMALRIEHWSVYLVAGIVIATRQHALGVLMHEAAHYRLLPSRAANDVVGDLLLAFPLGVSTTLYRRNHFAHHRWVNTGQDPDRLPPSTGPDWTWPKTARGATWVLFKDVCGLNALQALRIFTQWSPWRQLLQSRARADVSSAERARLAGFVVATVAGLWTTGAPVAVLALWWIPELTVLMAIFRVRALAEHYGIDDEHELNATRTVVPTWWERLLICPCHINFHLEHHLFPSVPHYNLPRLHALLMARPEYRSGAHVTYSYLGRVTGALRECVTRS